MSRLGGTFWGQHLERDPVGQAEEETGSVKAKPMGGDRHSQPLEHRDFLLDLMRAEPDLTLTEIRGRLAQRRIIVGHARVWRFFAREKINFKKKPHAAEQDDETLDNVEQSPTL